MPWKKIANLSSHLESKTKQERRALLEGVSVGMKIAHAQREAADVPEREGK